MARIALVLLFCLFAASSRAVSFYSESNTILFVGELKGELIWGMFDPDSDESYFNGETEGGDVEVELDDVKIKVPQEKGDPDSEYWTDSVGFLILGRDLIEKYDLKFNLQTSDLKFLPRSGELSKTFIGKAKKYIGQDQSATSGSTGYLAFPSIAYCGVRKSINDVPLAKRTWTNGTLKVVTSTSGFTPTVLIEDSRTNDNVFGITEIGCEEVMVRIGKDAELTVWGAGEVKTTASFLSHVLGTPVYELHDYLFLNNAILKIESFEEAEDVAVIKIGGNAVEDAWNQYLASSNDKRILMISTLFGATELVVRYDKNEYSAKFDQDAMDNELYTEKEQSYAKVRSIRRSGMNHMRPIKTYMPKPTIGTQKLAPMPTM